MDSCQNSFNVSKGMVQDFNPLLMGNDMLSNNLNGTFYTYNGNEGMLQNDMGNGRVQNAKLPPGYVPVGMQEYGGIVYIVSYNPIKNESQIGSFPSPERNVAVDSFGNSALIIEDESFIKENNWDPKVGYELSYNRLAIVGETVLNPGDSFVIMVKKESTLDRLISYRNKIYTETGDLIMHLAVIDSNNNITYIEENLNKYQENNYWLYPVDTFPEDIEELSVDDYRKQITNYHVYDHTTSGKLAIILELAKIENFEQFFRINFNDNTQKFDVTFTYKNDLSKNINKLSNTFLKGIKFLYTLESLPQETVNYIKYNSSTPEYDLSSFVFTMEGFEKTEKLKFNATPYDKWSYSNSLKTSGYIDFSKIGDNTIEFNIWKYFVKEDSIDIYWGLSTYLEDKYKISKVTFTFLDYYYPGTIVYNTKYICNARENYNGQFKETISFKQSLGELPDSKILTLSKNNFYAVRIDLYIYNTEIIGDIPIIKESFLKFIYTTPIFNNEFNKLTPIDDFTYLDINNIINTNFIEDKENSTLIDISTDNIYENGLPKIFGDYPINLTDTNGFDNYKCSKYSDFELTSKNIINNSLEDSILYPFSVNESCINYIQENYNNKLKKAVSFKLLFTQNSKNTNIKTTNNVVNNFLNLTTSTGETLPPPYINNIPTTQQENSFSLSDDPNYNVLELIDNKKQITFKALGRTMRRISTVNLYNSKYSYTGQVLEPFYKEELIFDGNKVDANNFRVLTAKGSQRFGFSIKQSNSLDENEFGYVAMAGALKGSSHNYATLQYDGFEKSDVWKDITQNVMTDFINSATDYGKFNYQKPTVCFCTGEQSNDGKRSWYHPVQQSLNNVHMRDYSIEPSTRFFNNILQFNKEHLWGSPVFRYVYNKKWVIAAWLCSDDIYRFVNLFTLRSGSGESWGGEKDLYNSLVQIYKKIYLVQDRKNGLISIVFPNETINHNQFDTNYTIKFQIKKILNTTGTNNFLYKINTNNFEKFDGNDDVKTNIITKLFNGIYNKEVNLNNIPSRNLTKFSNFSENDIKEIFYSFNYGNSIDMSDVNNYFFDIKTQVLNNTINLVGKDSDGNLCNTENVYFVQNKKYYNQDNEILKNYNFGEGLPYGKANFNKIKTEVNIWKKFTVKNIKDGDNIPVINQNYIKSYIPIDGGYSGWADTGGGKHTSYSPTMHLVHFFKYNALINTTLT